VERAAVAEALMKTLVGETTLSAADAGVGAVWGHDELLVNDALASIRH
jgi:hypothetical protein